MCLMVVPITTGEHGYFVQEMISTERWHETCSDLNHGTLASDNDTSRVLLLTATDLF